jgi:phospholipid/cholesterol/gamma-HCH transport system substrate-binding protein
MTRRRGATAIASNPVLVGVATTLVIVVAVFLAYNANAGLPWVPSYRITAEVPSAANLVRGNEARIGGLRVGTIDKIKPIRRKDGTYAAILDLKLETRVRPLPVDSKLIIRPRSALGLKYVQITRGSSKQGFKDGARIPISAYERPRPVDIDVFYSMFDEKTRNASQENLRGYGSSFAGRGESLNRTIEALVPLATNAAKVFGVITEPGTRFENFFRSQGRAAEIVAPVAEIQAALWASLDQTFTAFAEVAYPYIQQSITRGPSGLDTATDVFPKVRPFFKNSEQFFAELQPGFHALRASHRDLANGFVAGATNVRRSVALNRRLTTFLTALDRLAKDPVVPIALRDLVETVKALDPTLQYLTPTQTVCNYVGLLFRNASFLLSEGDANGTWLRFVPLITPQGPNNETGPSAAPSSGGGPDQTNATRNFVHNNAYPNTAAPGQTRECEAANEKYQAGKTTIGNLPGGQGTVTDEQKVEKKKTKKK